MNVFACTRAGFRRALSLAVVIVAIAPVSLPGCQSLRPADSQGDAASRTERSEPQQVAHATRKPQAASVEKPWQKVKVSFYGTEFAGRRTANGETFDPNAFTAAHRSLPFGTEVAVRNPDNGREIKVRINDRGPFVRGRTLDISTAAARKLGVLTEGVASLEMKVLRRGEG